MTAAVSTWYLCWGIRSLQLSLCPCFTFMFPGPGRNIRLAKCGSHSLRWHLFRMLLGVHALCSLLSYRVRVDLHDQRNIADVITCTFWGQIIKDIVTCLTLSWTPGFWGSLLPHCEGASPAFWLTDRVRNGSLLSVMWVNPLGSGSSSHSHAFR